jgi:arylsulfatase A-like enzyme
MPLDPQPGRRARLASILLFAGLVAAGAAASGEPLPRLVLDLVGQPQRVHRRFAGSLVIDLGSPERHKHTASDWKSGWSGDLTAEGTSFSRITDWAAWLRFEGLAGESGGGTVAVRARAEAPCNLLLRLNDRLLGRLRLEPGRFVTGRLETDAGIVEGQNRLVLQPVRQEGDAECLVEVDRVVISPFSAQPDPGGEADTPRSSRRAEDSGALELGDGDSVTAYLLLPLGAPALRLSGEASGDRARPRIGVRGDGVRAPGELEVRLPPDGSVVEVPLGDSGGTAVEADLMATGGDVRLTRAEVVDMPVERTPALPGTAASVVLILVDTLRADRLGLYEPGSRVKTPEIQELGKGGVVFERATAPGSWTKPSVASLLTGLYPDSHGVERHESALAPSLPFMPELLARKGLETAAFVGNGYISASSGFHRGWDVWSAYGGPGSSNSARSIVDGALAWLRGRDRERPFFLYVHLVDPHAPYRAPGRFRDIYADRRGQSRIRPASTATLLRRFLQGRFCPNRADLRRLEALYDAEITYMDHHIGRLVGALDRGGPSGETLVIFTSDHGEEFMEHGHLGHGQSLHEGVVRIPLVARYTGASKVAPRRSLRDVSLVDVLPTVCREFGIGCPDAEGRSFLRPDTGGIPPAGAVFASLPQRGERMVRAGSLKAIFRGRELVIYATETDPGETHDLAEERPVAAAAFRDALGEHLRGLRGTRPPERPVAAVFDDATRRQLEALGYLEVGERRPRRDGEEVN